MHVYMSDHGDPTLDYPMYAEHRLHTVFMIKTENGKHKEENDFLSINNMIKVIMAIREGRTYDEFFDDKVYLEEYDTYEKNRVKRLIDNLASKEEWMQVQAIRTKNDLYVLFADGEERYFRDGDESNNLISESCFKDITKQYKAELQHSFINPYSEEYFKYTRLIYDKYNIRLLCEKTEVIDDII